MSRHFNLLNFNYFEDFSDTTGVFMSLNENTIESSFKTKQPLFKYRILNNFLNMQIFLSSQAFSHSTSRYKVKITPIFFHQNLRKFFIYLEPGKIALILTEIAFIFL